MRINNFSQQSIHDWAQAAGTAGPWNSSVSLLQRGKLDPKPQFWVAFGTLNNDLAAGNFKYVTDRRLKDRLNEAKPFLTEHGKPATATDLFSMFIGELQPAEIYMSTPVITDEDAVKRSDLQRELFAETAKLLMLPPMEAWLQVEPYLSRLSTKQKAKAKDVLSGWANWSGEEIQVMTDPGETVCWVGMALKDWRMATLENATN